MNTSPGATMCPCLHQSSIIARVWRRALLGLAALCLLAACSATRIAYNQAHTAAYWWIDGYVDLANGQSTQLRADLDRFFVWHRRTELPAYAGRLAQWQNLVTRDTSTDQICAEFDAVRVAYQRLVERSLEPLAALALQLTPAQMQHMQRHQAKGNQEFEKKYFEGDAADRLEDRLERYVDRYETLYGTLTQPQLQLLRTTLQRSSFDPRRSRAERLRRQAGLLRTIAELQTAQGGPGPAQQPAPAGAVAALRAWSQELERSPTPGYADYQARQVREGCAQFATLHNSTSAEQRQHAVELLQRYEDDLRALSAQD